MRREELYLADIVDAADAITRFIADADAQTFAENDLLRSAVLNKLAIIGEAAARTPSPPASLPNPFLHRSPL